MNIFKYYIIVMNSLKYNIILFLVMFFISLFFNSMNVLAYDIKDIYFSYTLIYSSLYMASLMIWAHQIVYYIYSGMIHINILLFGLFLSCLFAFILRNQYFINEKEWLKRMIGHHSTALTTTYNLLNKNINNNVKQLAKNIIIQQEYEINNMKKLLKK